MEAPPLPEGAIAVWSEYENKGEMVVVDRHFTADQLRERDAYWLAKVEEAVKAERELWSLLD